MKAIDSLAGLILGWIIAAIVYMALSMIVREGSDLWIMTLVPGMFALAGWLLFIVPAVYLLPTHWALRTPLPKVAFIGGCYGVLMYALMVCTWFRKLWVLAWYPAIIVAIAAVVFACIQRVRAGGKAPPQPAESRKRHPRTAKILFAITFIIAAALTSLIWLVDIKHTATRRATWSVCDPKSSPIAREGIPTVQITVIEGPTITMFYSSARIHDYLVTLPTNQVDVVVSTTTDFGRIRSFNIVSIGDLPPKFDPDELSVGGLARKDR